jgi:octaprenyl-diphosphate synthase
VAFQITDDTLDLTSSPEALGKPIGSDVRGGKVTLPLMHALRNATADERLRLEILVRDGAPAETFREILDRYGSIGYALGVARDHADRALQVLDTLPHGPARDSLLTLTEFVVARRR